MAIESPKAPLGYADYAALDDGRRYQLIEGELVLSPSPSPRHQNVVGQLYMLLQAHVLPGRLGKVFFAPLDVVLRADAPGTVLQPDVLFISRDRKDILTEKNVQGAPDLAVEVLSPSNARLDTVRKLGLYARYGVRELWFVSNEFDQLQVMKLGSHGAYGQPSLYKRGDTLTTDLLPGFTLAVDDIFLLADDEEDVLD